MVNYCCVVGCTNRVGKKVGLRFFRFPLREKERCARWTAAVPRLDWTPGIDTRICNEHFAIGEHEL